MDYTEQINNEENSENKVSEPVLSEYQVTRHKVRVTHTQSSQNHCEEEPLKPYTMEELNTRLDCAEADVKEGRVMSRAEASRRMKEHIAQYMQI